MIMFDAPVIFRPLPLLPRRVSPHQRSVVLSGDEHSSIAARAKDGLVAADLQRGHTSLVVGDSCRRSPGLVILTPYMVRNSGQ